MTFHIFFHFPSPQSPFFSFSLFSHFPHRPLESFIFFPFLCCPPGHEKIRWSSSHSDWLILYLCICLRLLAVAGRTFPYPDILFQTQLDKSTDKATSLSPILYFIHCNRSPTLTSQGIQSTTSRQNGSKSFSLGKVRRHLGCHSLTNRQGQHHHHGLRLGRLSLRYRHDLVRRQPASTMVGKKRGKRVQFILHTGCIHTIERVAADYVVLCNVKPVVGTTRWKRTHGGSVVGIRDGGVVPEEAPAEGLGRE